MVQYAEECRTLGIPFIWDPGQQCARMSGDELRGRYRRRRDRHLQRLRIRADQAEDRPRRGRRSSRSTGALIVTRGEHGCTDPPGQHRDDGSGGAAAQHRRSDRRRRRVPRRAPQRSRRPARSLEVRCRLGSVAATYALEHLGRPEPRLYLGRIPRPLRDAFWAALGHICTVAMRLRMRYAATPGGALPAVLRVGRRGWGRTELHSRRRRSS